MTLENLDRSDVAARRHGHTLADHFTLVLDQAGCRWNHRQRQSAPAFGGRQFLRAAQAGKLFANDVRPLDFQAAERRAFLGQRLARQPHRRFANCSRSRMHRFCLRVAQFDARAGFFQRIET